MKKIKFPLEMKDGVRVRTIEELRENFNAEKLLVNYFNGKLITWLKDRSYTEYLQRLENLNSDRENFLYDLCGVLDIDMQINADDIESKVLKFSQIKKHTDDKDIIKNFQLVAETQEELDAIMQNNPKKIYLLGKRFTIPADIHNCLIEGINTPIIDFDSNEYIDFNKKQVEIINTIFGERYQKTCSKRNYKGEYKDGEMYVYTPSQKIKNISTNQNRDKCESIFGLIQDNLYDFEFTQYILEEENRKNLSIMNDAGERKDFETHVYTPSQKIKNISEIQDIEKCKSIFKTIQNNLFDIK